MERLFSIGEVSEFLGVAKYKITYMIESGIVSKPLEISKRRMFTTNDIEQIKNQIERRQSKQGIKNKQIINKEKINVNPN